MPKDISSKLRSIQELWESADTIANSNVSDGDYDATIEKMEVTVSKKDKLMVTITFKIIGTDHDGKEIMSFFVLENLTGAGFFKGFADVIGFELPQEAQELPEALTVFKEEFKDICQLRLNTKNGYQNIDITGVIQQT